MYNKIILIVVALILAGCSQQENETTPVYENKIEEKNNIEKTANTIYTPNYTVQNITVQTPPLNASIKTRDQENVTLPGCNCNSTQYCNYNKTCKAILSYLQDQPQQKNHALDIVIFIDPAANYSDLTDQRAFEVLEITKKLFYNKTGVTIVVREQIERKALGNLILNNAPEVIVVFSKQETAGTSGGFSFTSEQKHNPTYCNEFELVTKTQDNVGIAVVNWHHWYARCGYERQGENLVRTSQIPNTGECSNNKNDTCMLRQDGKYYQCASTVDNLYSNLDYSTASTIIHEITHTLDRDSYGHFGQIPGCEEERNRYANQNDFIRASEENFNMCPKTFDLIQTRFNGC
ncbi:hypothetical protein J4450_07085 [Candidatus Micrarchaeota archaeon]|nr:hypothetical protein [Candidatus Micrarchaeota archaeon]